MLKVTIIVLNWNRGRETLQCLTSINKLNKKSYHLKVIVVDNASSDQSFKMIKQNFPWVILIKNSTNLGFAGGNNVGIKYTLKDESDFIFILNNDTLLDPKIIEEMLKTHYKFKANIISPKIYFRPGYEFHKSRYKSNQLGKVIWSAGGVINWKNVYGFHRGVDEIDQGQFDKEELIDFATGAALFVKNSVFKKIGLFDEKYFLYYEDLDFCQRAKNKGEKIIFCPKAHLWHSNLGTGNRGSNLQDYYISRNRLLFGMRYAPFRSKLALLKEAIKILYSGRFWQRKGVFDFFSGKFGKGSYTQELNDKSSK